MHLAGGKFYLGHLEGEWKKHWRLLPLSCTRIQGVFVVPGHWGERHIAVTVQAQIPQEGDDLLLPVSSLPGES